MEKTKPQTILMVLLALFIAGYTYSQNNIKGLILSDTDEPIAYANIVLYSMPDSIFIKGAVSDDDGSFIFPPTRKGSYFCMVSMLGYSTYNTPNFELDGESETYSLGNIQLSQNNQLDEVVVTAQKSMIEVQADKIVFNVQSSPSAAGSNGLDLLSQAPGVTVDMDNNIQLLGKGGVRIFINGRPSRLSGADLVNLLQNMNADNIDNIEVISNPSSRFEASGNAGIININLKKNINTGFNGNLSSSASLGNFLRYSNSLALNYGGEKIRASLGISQSEQDFQDDFLDIRKQNNYVLGLDSRQINSSGNLGLRGDIEFSLGAKHILNLSGNAIFNTNDNTLNSSTSISQNDQLSEILVSESILDGESTNYNYNLNYNFAINKSSSLSSELSLGKFNSMGSTLQPNRYLEPDGNSLISVSDRSFDSNTFIDLFSAKVDYEKSWNKFKLSTGSKYVSIITDNEFAFFNIINSTPELDLTRSNDFTYNEDVFALYGILDLNLNEFTSLNAGIRMENTSSRGVLESIQVIDNTDVKRRYTNFFPNIGLSFSDNETHAVNLSVGRRISRPNYQNLNPFESPQSELAIWKGNPFLNPSYTMNYQLVYSFKQRLTITNQYSVTTDFFANLIEVSGDKSNIIIPRNMDRITNYALSITYPFDITKFWNVMVMFNGSYNTYTGLIEGIEIDLTNTNWNYRVQNNIKLPWGMQFELTYNQGSKWIWRGSVEVAGNSNLRFGLRKDFFDKQLQLRITGSDILYTGSEYYYYGNYGGLEIDGVRTFDNRRFGISGTWKFGNQKVKTVKKVKGGLSDELNRL